ncbi:MAG: class A beta-lactamase, partial [Dokdonella sp.]
MISLSRRRLLSATAVASSALMFRHAMANHISKDDLHSHLEALERAAGGRLGVSIMDVDSGRRLAHRGDERFPMCSTFKWIAAALVLVRVDRGEERLDRRIAILKSELVPYSPATEKHVGGDGMSMAELCQAAVTLSDNAAANLILANVGGPSGFTRFVRSVGDTVTRLDRIEPDMSEGTPGDPRDTTSPIAMLETLRKLVLGDTLSMQSRGQLTAWLVANTT